MNEYNNLKDYLRHQFSINTAWLNEKLQNSMVSILIGYEAECPKTQYDVDKLLALFRIRQVLGTG